MEALWQVRSLRDWAILLPIAYLVAAPHAAWAQDSAGDGNSSRGDRAAISVTVRDSSRSVITVPASVRLLHDGIPVDQSNTSHGRAFFILRTLGEYTVLVEAVGYKPAQRDFSVRVAVKFEIDVTLQKESDANSVSGVPAGPLLAPNAKEALEKGAGTAGR